MCPRVIFGEIGQEGGGGNRACARRADVGNVGKIGFELIFVSLKERQLPCFVVHVAGGGKQTVNQSLIVAHHAADVMTQGDDARAGQGGDVDDGFGLELFGVSKRVTQNQTAFGIGVQHFDGQAFHAFHDVARFVCRAGRHVFTSGDDGNQVDRQLQFDGGAEGTDDGCRAAHVELHFVHVRTGFEGDATSVEGNAFADQDDGGGFFVGRTKIAQFDQIWVFNAAFGDRPERTHVFSDVVFFNDFSVCAQFFGFGFSGAR